MKKMIVKTGLKTIVERQDKCVYNHIHSKCILKRGTYKFFIMFVLGIIKINVKLKKAQKHLISSI